MHWQLASLLSAARPVRVDAAMTMNASARDTAADNMLAKEGSLLPFRLRRYALRALQPLIGMRDAFLFGEGTGLRAAGRPVAWPAAHERQPFFILGNPRSGTTMLRETLNRHPDLCIPPENGALQHMIRVFGQFRGAPWPETVDAVLARFSDGYEASYWDLDLERVRAQALALDSPVRSLGMIFELLYREYASTHASEKSRWGDKSTPGHFDYLDKLGKVFPAATYVHIVRDPRDSVLSCIRAGFYGQSIVKAAHAWTDNNRRCRQFGLSCGLQRFLQLRYEDLVTNPEQELTRVLAFLRLNYHPEMLDRSDVSQTASRDVQSIEHHRNVLKPISASSVGVWRREMPAHWLAKVMPIVQTEMMGHGYEVDEQKR